MNSGMNSGSAGLWRPFSVRCFKVRISLSDGVNAMSGDEKAKSKGEQAKGKVKEAAGRAVGNERLTAEGRAEQAKDDARQAKEKIKDTLKD